MFERLATQVLRECRAGGVTLATAESCTGGALAAALAQIPGASDVLFGGIVAYHNSCKINILNVNKDVLNENGAVSAEVARAMALGARRLCRSTLAISTTGIAGPGGGTASKPIGTVYIGLSHALYEDVWPLALHGSRRDIQAETVRKALERILISVLR